MKREIKFRAWDGKSWTTVGMFIGTENGSRLFGIDTSLEGIAVMQYTGLKDKNGKEIYEGDIVRGNESGYDGIKINKWDEMRIGKVDFSHCSWVYQINGQDHQILMYLQNIEVIGNIYENPELLNPQQ
jgi:uncharacterized phage protein (TIGR01671 family)